MGPTINLPPGPALLPKYPPPGQHKPLPSPTKTGKIPFNVPGSDLKSETWYALYGGEITPSTVPLICLHGGPGMAHNYILTCSHVASPSRPVILYDQIGCGNSTHFRNLKGDTNFWVPELFMAELLNLVAALGIQKYDLLGQSWGGMLAATFATGVATAYQPTDLRKLIIADSPSDMHTWVAVADLMRQRLPSDVQETLTRLEKAGQTDTAEYEAAVNVFYERFVCRVTPFPQEFVDTVNQMKKDDTVYLTMNGPSEFFVSGSLKHWKITDQLKNIEAETLLINGRFDEAQDITMEPFFREISGKVKWVRFAESSHCPHLEETEAFVEAVSRFLDG